MDFYFAGAEQPLYMRQLIDLDVTHIAISFFEWQRRHSNDDVYKHVPNGVKVCITPGIAKKEDVDFRAFGEDYIEFAERNSEQCIVYGLDSEACPIDVKRDVHNRLSILPNYVPFPVEGVTLEDLAQHFERVGVNARTGKSIPTNELRRIRASLYGSNITDAKVLKGARFAATTSFAWLSARRYGELWVYSRGRLHHYAAANREKAARAHRDAIEALGVDPGACVANDPAALVAVAVKSLQEMAQSLSKRPRDRQEAETADATASGTPGDPVVTAGTQGDASAIVPFIERVRVPLPGILLDDQEGVQKVRSQGANMRRCDSCNLSDQCPEYHEHASCAFSLPVEIKSRAQWEAASHYLLEVQMQRIAFAHMAEQLEGSELTPRVGQEMDRFYKMLSNQKDLEQKPDPIPGGAMSTFFPPAPQIGDSNGVQEGSEEGDSQEDFIEGELVDDGLAYDEEDATSQGRT